MKKFSLFFMLYTSSIICSNVEYKEDAYLQQADKETINHAQKIAEQMGYTNQYQIIFPKKPAFAINPYNKFMSTGINPLNKINMIIVNPEWFKNLSTDEQNAFFAINFNKFIHGNTAPISQKITLFHLIISWILIFALTIIFKKFSFLPDQVWKRFFISLACVFTFNWLIGSKIQNLAVNYLNNKHAQFIYKDTISKGIDKNNMIQAFTRIHNSIKEEINNGESFFETYEKDLSKKIDWLKS